MGSPITRIWVYCGLFVSPSTHHKSPSTKLPKEKLEKKFGGTRKNKSGKRQRLIRQREHFLWFSHARASHFHDSKTSTTTAPLLNQKNGINPPSKPKQKDFLNHLEVYLSTSRSEMASTSSLGYPGTPPKIVLASSGFPESLPLTQWLKSFESSAGVSRKAFRLCKFVQDVNAVRSSKFDLNQELLALIAYGGEGLYFVHVFIQNAYAYSKQTYRGRGDARTNGTVSQLLQTSSRGSSRTPIIQEGSKQIVSYGRGGRSSELMGDFSMALAFALENGAKLGRMDTSSTRSMLGFLNQIGRGTVESSKINPNE